MKTFALKLLGSVLVGALWYAILDRAGTELGREAAAWYFVDVDPVVEYYGPPRDTSAVSRLCCKVHVW